MELVSIYKTLGKYSFFLLAIFAIFPPLFSSYSYFTQLTSELASAVPSSDLNVDFAQVIVDNSSYLDGIHSITRDMSLYIYILFILIGLYFSSPIRNQLNSNSYYILRNRLSYKQYLKMIYTSTLRKLFIIELTLTSLIYILSFILLGGNSSFELFIESLIPFVFLFIFSSLVTLIVINLNFVISNIYVLQGLPFAILYAPILISTLLNKVIHNQNLMVSLSYLTFVPTLDYSTTEQNINLLNYLQGNLSLKQSYFLFQDVNPFIMSYMLLIIIFCLSIKIGKDHWYE